MAGSDDVHVEVSRSKRKTMKGRNKKSRRQDEQDPSNDSQPVVSSESEPESERSSKDQNNEGGADAAPKNTGDENKRKSLTAHTESNIGGYSRLFAPYRSLGIVSHNGAFHLLPHQNSGSAMACVAIGERFHLLQCDRLHPVLVSQAVPSGATIAGTKSRIPNKSLTKGSSSGGAHEISHLVSDSSLSVSLVAHGPTRQSRHVTLYQRTRPIASLKVTPATSASTSSKEWKIVNLLHLGRIKVTMTKGEKKGTKENALLCAVVLSSTPTGDQDGLGIPIVGDDESVSDESLDSSESDSSDEESSSSSEEDNVNDCCGQVVMVVATRTALQFLKRIPLSFVPSFVPRVAIHPSTYVNKILLGGSCQRSAGEGGRRNSGVLLLVNVKTGKLIHNFTCLPSVHGATKSRKHVEVTALEQSPAVDTIAVGTSQGMVHLINTRHDRLLFSLGHKPRKSKTKNKDVRITSISFRTDGSAMQYGIAPMAVGRSDGNITVWDLTPPKEDSDSDSDIEHNTTAAAIGRTILCEMEQVHYPGGVAKIQYFPGEPLLLSTGTNSNSVLMHIFDNPDHSGRLLRHRKGHTAPPKHIRYLHLGAGAGGGILANAADGTDATACQILSSGSSDRTLRLFSTVRTVLDKEYSQGRGLDKRAKQLRMKSKEELLFPPLTAMATSEARIRDWGDLVTIHQDHAFAYVWSSKRGAQSGPILRQENWNVSAMKTPPPAAAHATSIALSTCGNYALVGTRGGLIYRYNVQSGNPRGSYPMTQKEDFDRNKRLMAGDVQRTVKALEKKMKISNRASNLDKNDVDVVELAKSEQRKLAMLKFASHEGFAVTGVAVDAVNKTVISVGADAKLILWNFKSHAPHKKCPYKLPMAATKLCHIRDSDLAAIALEDYSVLLFDCSNLATVRRFGIGGSNSTCHTGPISDLGFSPDGRTLYTSSLDGTVRVWDVPTNTCVDWLGFRTPPTSLTVSPTGEFLATTHAGKLGISLWSDRSFYQTVHVDGAASLLEPARMDDPMPIAETKSSDESVELDSELLHGSLDLGATQRQAGNGQDEDTSDLGPAVAKEAGLITLSGLPPAHWKNLFHLELVKQRNKPKEAPKKPPSAPFFLQWRGAESATGDPFGGGTQDKGNAQNGDAAEWDAVWSDDDDEGNQSKATSGNPPSRDDSNKRVRDHGKVESVDETKRRKISHHRSYLASLLDDCSSDHRIENSRKFQPVTEYISTLGPSAIDVALSSLCNGMHDLEEGLPLLVLASSWLLEACQSRERYDAVNAYLHRFLYLHASVIANIDSSSDGADELQHDDAHKLQRETLLGSIASLRDAQRKSSETLQGKMEHALCLLRHFSRMV